MDTSTILALALTSKAYNDEAKGKKISGFVFFLTIWWFVWLVLSLGFGNIRRASRWCANHNAYCPWFLIGGLVLTGLVLAIPKLCDKWYAVWLSFLTPISAFLLIVPWYFKHFC